MSLVTREVLTNVLTRLRNEVLPMVENPIVTYTIIIDQNNTNCETACTYADDALGMTKGSNDWDTRPIFKDIKPCVFKNGEVVYYLNPNNWNKKENGSAAVLTGEDGDVMIEFPKFAYRIYTDENDCVHVTVSNDETVIAADERFTYDAFSRLEEGDLDHFYKGAYKGYVDANNKLRSIVGVIPSSSRTIAQFRETAQANGSHYQQSTYAHLKAIQCLYLIKYGNRNGQVALGNGAISGLSAPLINGFNATSVDVISTENSTATLGMCFGDTSDKTKHMRLFGIEDFWGDIWEWIDGLTTDASKNIIVSWNNFSNEGITATQESISSGFTRNFSGYPKKVQGESISGFMPKSLGGSNTTCWADSAFLYASCGLRFGGDWTSDLFAGPFELGASGAASHSGSLVGARLDFS